MEQVDYWLRFGHVSLVAMVIIIIFPAAVCAPACLVYYLAVSIFFALLFGLPSSQLIF
jgi:hypothetical protein